MLTTRGLLINFDVHSYITKSLVIRSNHVHQHKKSEFALAERLRRVPHEIMWFPARIPIFQGMCIVFHFVCFIVLLFYFIQYFIKYSVYLIQIILMQYFQILGFFFFSFYFLVNYYFIKEVLFQRRELLVMWA